MRRAAEILVWTLLLAAVWVATLTTVTATELVAAAAGGLVGGAVATATRPALGIALRVPRAWSAALARLPGAVVADTGRLAAAVVRAVRERRPLGAERTLTLPAEDPAVAWTRVALAAPTVSATPGAYVVDVRPAEPDRAGSMAVHALDPPPSALERAVTR